MICKYYERFPFDCRVTVSELFCIVEQVRWCVEICECVALQNTLTLRCFVRQYSFSLLRGLYECLSNFLRFVSEWAVECRIGLARLRYNQNIDISFRYRIISYRSPQYWLFRYIVMPIPIFLQCFDTGGSVIWPVKPVSDMTWVWRDVKPYSTKRVFVLENTTLCS